MILKSPGLITNIVEKVGKASRILDKQASGHVGMLACRQAGKQPRSAELIILVWGSKEV